MANVSSEQPCSCMSCSSICHDLTAHIILETARISCCRHPLISAVQPGVRAMIHEASRVFTTEVSFSSFTTVHFTSKSVPSWFEFPCFLSGDNKLCRLLLTKCSLTRILNNRHSLYSSLVNAFFLYCQCMIEVAKPPQSVERDSF